jgi:very-short-patch-repair endonuclease
VLSASADAPVAPDPLMTELADRLRREGLVVAERIGTGPHRVDLALAAPDHPERWLVAVDGDGPGYATWRGTRDRDRLWPQALERQGWRHLRVWSTDLYRDPAREVARIVTAVREQARALGTPIPDDSGEPTPTVPEPGAQVAMTESGPTVSGPTVSEPAAPETGGSNGSAQPAGSPRPAARRRRRAVRRGTTETADPAAQTTDDTDAGWGEHGDNNGAHEQWLQDQRPPHWD